MANKSETAGQKVPIMDSDGDWLSHDREYRIRFADGTDLGLVCSKMAADGNSWAAKPVPSNRGPAIYPMTDGKVYVGDTIHLVGHVTWDDGGPERTSELYLYIDQEKNFLNWYETRLSHQHGVTLDKVGNRVYMWAKNMGTIYGLRPTSNVNSSSRIEVDGWKTALEFQFVKAL